MVEVYGDEAKAWADAHGRALAKRLEIAGRDRVLLRERRRSRCSPTSRRAAGVRYLHRPANLEDLFIKLTGRELRD